MCARCKRAHAQVGMALCESCEIDHIRMAATFELALTAIPAPVDELPTRLERLDAAIQQCRQCDRRYIPESGHKCGRPLAEVIAA